ncbi:MAG: histidine phosphatase family protein [Actinomycetota bacterium]|nr:histidine phosphatase family protein [Actinomycetota bacterium]
MTRLFLVRHGQSEWNALGKWQGQADPPLSKLGEEQAFQAASRLPSFGLLAASSLQRAIQTADIFAKAKAWTPDEIIVEDRLKERDAGAFSGLTRSEIDEQFPGYLGNDRWPDDWEPDNDLIERLMVGFERLTSLVSKSPQRENDDILAISHGGCIYALEGLCGEKYERIPNLAGRWFEITGSDIKLGERVHLLPPEEETFPDHFTI